MKKISAIVIMLLLASSAVKTRFRCHERVKTCRMCRKSVASSLQQLCKLLIINIC